MPYPKNAEAKAKNSGVLHESAIKIPRWRRTPRCRTEPE
jgi:hypothetical protein